MHLVALPDGVRLADDGPGVDDARREALLRALAERADAGGMGLGLRLADLVARAHGGAVRLPAPPAGERGFVVVTAFVVTGNSIAGAVVVLVVKKLRPPSVPSVCGCEVGGRITLSGVVAPCGVVGVCGDTNGIVILGSDDDDVAVVVVVDTTEIRDSNKSIDIVRCKTILLPK